MPVPGRWRYNRSLSRGEGNNIEACPGGVEQNRSLSRGQLQVYPGEVEI